MNTAIAKARGSRNGSQNSLQKEDLPVHGWYRFVLSYPPHLVRRYLAAFGLGSRDLLLDPFCGTGTTLVEAKKNRIPSIGCDAHPVAVLVSRVKTNWNVEVEALRSQLSRIHRRASQRMTRHGFLPLSIDGLSPQIKAPDVVGEFQLTPDEVRLIPTGFVSQGPLQRLLILRSAIEASTADLPAAVQEFFLVALAHVIANGAGNFAFGPEIYRTKAKPDYDVLGHFVRQAELMITELLPLQRAGLGSIRSSVVKDDARRLAEVPEGISAVITSPPYPNEKDYTRTTRVESILLRMITDKAGLRNVKESLLRSNTRNIFVDDTDGDEVSEFASIQRVCTDIEKRRIELSKDSGFERLYHKVVSHYFGGMRRHFRVLRSKLESKAKLAYVVGDQLSFLLVPVATARLLSEVAAAEGYRTIGIELWRERVGTKVRNSPTNDHTVRIREEILILEKT